MALVDAERLAGLRDILRGRRRVYYGWKILAVATAAMALGAGLSMASFGLYVGPLEQEFGWTRAEVSLAFSFSVLAGGLSAPLVGYWVDSRGPRSAILVGGLLVALSFVLLASTQALWQFYLFYAIHAVCRQMMFFLPFQALMSRWFERRRGIVLSILGSGFSLGGFVVLPLAAAAITGFGWRGAYLFSGAIIAVFFLTAGLKIVRNNPSEVGQYVDGDEPAPRSETGEPPAPIERTGMTLKEAARTPMFWICALGFMLFFYGMMGWMVHQVPFYESKGISRATATMIVSLSAGASIVARLSMGVVADRFERFEPVVVVLLGLLMAAMTTLLISTSPPAILIFLLFWVIGASAGPMVESLVLIKAFGIRYFGTILGAMLVIETAGQIISPALAGAIFDRTGSYDGALVMFIGVFAVGLLLFLVAWRMPPPLERHAAVEGRAPAP